MLSPGLEERGDAPISLSQGHSLCIPIGTLQPSGGVWWSCYAGETQGSIPVLVAPQQALPACGLMGRPAGQGRCCGNAIT